MSGIIHPPESGERPLHALNEQGLWALVGGLVYACVAIATIMLTGDGRNAPVVWPADAVILALLLSRPRRDWPTLVLAGWLGNLLANGVTRGWAPGIVLFGVVNMGETLLAAQILMSGWGTRGVWPGKDIAGDGRALARFALVAGLISPALGALAQAGVSQAIFDQALWSSLLRGFAGNALGFVIFTPFFISLFDGSYARAIEAQLRERHVRGFAQFALHMLAIAVVFGQSKLPLLFLVFPTLLVLSFALGRLATQAGVMLVAVAGAVASLHHDGPLVLIPYSAAFQTLCFQVFLAVLLCTALPVATVVAARNAERKLLREREELLRLIMAHSPDAIIGLDGEGVCRWADGPVHDYLGLDPIGLVGIPLDMIALSAGAALARLYHDSVRGDTAPVTVELHPVGRSRLTLEASLRLAPHRPGQAVGSVITLRDITARKVREAAISRRIETDDLTGVYNRAGFRQRLARAIAAAHGSPPRPLTLALLDVDHFKAINDTHGHPAGDRALAEIARRLLAGTREDDIVARLSGDEFAIALHCDIGTARTICDRIVRTLAAEPIRLGGNIAVLASISCGLAQVHAAMNLEALFDAADLALYDAKRSGRNAVRGAA